VRVSAEQTHQYKPVGSSFDRPSVHSFVRLIADNTHLGPGGHGVVQSSGEGVVRGHAVVDGDDLGPCGISDECPFQGRRGAAYV
jgi:hypothetical protein